MDIWNFYSLIRKLQWSLCIIIAKIYKLRTSITSVFPYNVETHTLYSFPLIQFWKFLNFIDFHYNFFP